MTVEFTETELLLLRTAAYCNIIHFKEERQKAMEDQEHNEHEFDSGEWVYDSTLQMWQGIESKLDDAIGDKHR